MRLNALDRLSRRRDLDALMATDAEQVAVTRHDELAPPATAAATT